ncbi:MAG: SpaA isopeptide-forming pilin-related protein, partial [Finegoldia magna]|nr:SpaA isopeptide-forming pilin-related protein [Finegoldia magna]
IKNAFTDENGKASFGEHPEGKYFVYEVKAPDGYEKNSVYFEVDVNESQEVSYKARFENSSATPQPGQDYFIDKGKEIGNPNKNIVTSVNQWLDYNEGQAYSRGERPKVWEAYRYESLKYHADITLSSSSKGDRFEIQFDPNLDFTQYFTGFPKLRINGKDVADPYFNYETNLLTYIFNEKTDGGPAKATIDLIGMIPSKYYAKNTGTYPFTITVQPNQTGISGQKYDKDIKAFFDAYDSGNDEPVQNYYFREIYEENGQYYVDVISYYNVIGDRNPYKKVNPKTLAYNWITTKFQGGNIANWVGEGTEPRQVLDRVKIYRTEANVRAINDGPLVTLVNDYMPLSMGYRAEQEPNIYRPVFNASVDPKQNATISQNGITLVYDKGQINPNGKLIDKNNQPLKIKMPSINNGEGYVIEQRFKIPDIDAFNNKWRAFVMNNGNLKSAFASGANKSFAKGDQTGGETPKYYKEDVGVINKKYTPGQFKIIKSNQSDNSKLAGATFELTDANNNTIYRTSGNDGELSFTNLAPGSYTLKETRAPKDFVQSEKRWTVNVYSDGLV